MFQGLPCLLILVGNGRMGDTFPDSFKTMDLRLTTELKASSTLTAFTQEMGRLCRYSKIGHHHAVIGEALYFQLESALNSGQVGFYSSFPPERVDNYIMPQRNRDGRITGYKPVGKNADIAASKRETKYHFLLEAEPQIGKTGAIITLLRLLGAPLREKYNKSGPEFMECDDLDADIDLDGENDSGEVGLCEELKQNWSKALPFWNDLDKMPPVPSTAARSAKYTDAFGAYDFDTGKPPAQLKMAIKKKRRGGSKGLQVAKEDDCIALKAKACVCNACMPRGDYPEKVKLKIDIDDVENQPAAIDVEMHLPKHYLDHLGGHPGESRRDELITNSSVPVIMSPSLNRVNTARLNLSHIMRDGGTKNKVADFLQFVFVRSGNYKQYLSEWGRRLAVVKLPDTMPDVDERVENGGVGYARRFIQRFAHRLNISSFFMSDDLNAKFYKTVTNGKGVTKKDETTGHIAYEPATLLEIIKHVTKIGEEGLPMDVEEAFEPHNDYKSTDAEESIAAYTGPKRTYGIIGIFKCSQRPSRFTKPFQKRHCTSFVWLNNDKLMAEGLLYQPWQAHEDLNMNNRVDRKGFHVLKMYGFKVFKQQLQDSCFLYPWDEALDLTNSATLGEPSRVSAFEIETTAIEYLQSLRIANVHGAKDKEQEVPAGHPVMDKINDFIKEKLKLLKSGQEMILHRGGKSVSFERLKGGPVLLVGKCRKWLIRR